MPAVELDGVHVWLSLPPGSDLLAEAKGLGYAHLRDGRLRYGVESSPLVVAFADRHQLDVDQKVRTRANKVAKQADVTFNRGSIHVLHDKTKRLPNLVDAVPIAMHRDSKKSHNYWSAPPSESARIVAWADQQGLSVSPAVREDAAFRWKQELAAFNLSSAVDVEHCPAIIGLTSVLDPIQKPPIAAIQQNRRLLLADVPGLGKTLESLACARIEGQETERLLVVCPSNLTPTWAAQISEHFTAETFSPLIASGREAQQIPLGVDVVIIGWAVLDAWVEELTQWAPDGLIIDEGQFAKSGKQQTVKRDTVSRNENGHLVFGSKQEAVGEGSIRATASTNIAASVRQANGLIMILTGTPMVNRPLELLALLEILGIEDVFGGAVSFKKRFCGPKEVRIPTRGGHRVKTAYKGATNLRELNTRLRSSGFYMRRTKEGWVASGKLKRKVVDGAEFYDRSAARRPLILRPPEHVMAEYNQAATVQSEYFADFAREVARTSRINLGTKAMQDKVAAKGAQELTRVGELRLLAARIKLAPIMAQVDALVAAGEKVVIAAHFKEIVDAYADRYGGLKIQGGMTPAKVEEAKRTFNSTPVEESPVIVLSMEACKAGHTLCLQEQFGAGRAARTMIFAEQGWVPGDVEQVEDRIWRFGQPREVHIRNYLIHGTTDMDIYRLRERKRKNLDTAIDGLGGDEPTGTERAMAGLLAAKLYATAIQGGGK